ncbi:MAG: LysM peptidoglycan-binding domain-containing protein [Thermoguttaceae bacterium]
MSKNKKNRDRDRNQNKSYSTKPQFPDSGENLYEETDYSEYTQEASEYQMSSEYQEPLEYQYTCSEEESNWQLAEQQGTEQQGTEQYQTEDNFAEERFVPVPDQQITESVPPSQSSYSSLLKQETSSLVANAKSDQVANAKSDRVANRDSNRVSNPDSKDAANVDSNAVSKVVNESTTADVGEIANIKTLFRSTFDLIAGMSAKIRTFGAILWKSAHPPFMSALRIFAQIPRAGFYTISAVSSSLLFFRKTTVCEDSDRRTSLNQLAQSADSADSLDESLGDSLAEINFVESVETETSEPEEDFDELAYERAIRSIRLKIAGATAIVLVSIGGFFGYRFYSSNDKAFAPYQPDELQRQLAEITPQSAEMTPQPAYTSQAETASSIISANNTGSNNITPSKNTVSSEITSNNAVLSNTGSNNITPSKNAVSNAITSNKTVLSNTGSNNITPSKNVVSSDITSNNTELSNMPSPPTVLEPQSSSLQPLYAQNRGDWGLNDDSASISVGLNDTSTSKEMSGHIPLNDSNQTDQPDQRNHSDHTNQPKNQNSKSPIHNVPVLGLGSSDQTSDSSAPTQKTPAPRTSQSVRQPLGLGATSFEEADSNPVFASPYQTESELPEPQPTLVQINPKYSLDSQPTVATTSTPRKNVGTDYSNTRTNSTTTVPQTTVPTTPGVPVPGNHIVPQTRPTPAFGSIGAEKGIKPFQPDSRSRSHVSTGETMIELVQPLQKQPERSGERFYTVREGDNLFNIAKRELGSTSYWHEILRLNEELLESNPDYLRPGLQLRLPDRTSSVSESTNRRRSRQ